MALPTEQQAQVMKTLDAYCDERVPIAVRDKVVLQYRIHGHDVLLFEKRPFFRQPERWIENPIAKFRYTKSTSLWTLLWPDRNSKWQDFEHIDAAEDFNALWASVHRVGTAIKQTVGCDRVFVMVIGIDVPHAHVHLIPSTADLSTLPLPPVVPQTADELGDMAAGFTAALDPGG